METAELISRALAPVVAHDAVRLAGSNPAPGWDMGSFGFWHGYEPALVVELQNRYFLGDDPWAVDAIARRPVPVAMLGVGDHGAQRLLAEHGVGCELRLVLRDGRGVWGVLTLARELGGRPFDAVDARRVLDLTPELIAALRGYVMAVPLQSGAPALPPGVVIMGPDNRVKTATPQAYRWKEQLSRERGVPAWMGELFFAGLAMRARDPHAVPSTVYGPSVTYGRWTGFHAELLPETGEVAMVIEAASGKQLLPVFCDWYGITARERQVLTEVLDGAPPKRIAGRLGVSPYTVNDHLKAIFRKTGAGGRDELVTAVTG
ncbi:DNA-binding transcriptional regulator, CsgD family [Amycolatopsis xylanica]|uniref:DNA-binding transcriptional regulator, CsgD family n=1 Tax=Amycolatopsis xylanica TaxID=589385 RepID=A0A1H2UP04_9PSEU|nr:DNA-binding transcriptional regulator, CsgD family [Amycolatopsis xylanica]